MEDQTNVFDQQTEPELFFNAFEMGTEYEMRLVDFIHYESSKYTRGNHHYLVFKIIFLKDYPSLYHAVRKDTTYKVHFAIKSFMREWSMHNTIKHYDKNKRYDVVLKMIRVNRETLHFTEFQVIDVGEINETKNN
jgi:hypothetical protein